MKRTYSTFMILAGLLLHLLGGCNRTYPYPDTLLEVDQLLNNRQADSALILLTHYKDTARHYDLSTQMYLNLLMIKAQDKCYITHTSDSLINEIVDYYEKHGPEDLLTEAYYLKGSVYEEIGDPIRSLEYFQKVLTRLEKTDEFRFKGLLCSRIGTLYMFQALYDEALPFFRKACLYNQLAGDSIGLVYGLRDLGRYYEVKKRMDSTFIYFNKAWNMAQNIQEAELEKIVAQEMAHAYLNYKDTNKVRFILEKIKNIKSNDDPAFTYNIWANFYKVTNRVDSMAFFYQKSLVVGNVHVKRKASKELYLIENKKQNYKEANRYMRLYVKQVDSIRKLTETESLRKMHALYNRERMELFQEKLKRENIQLRYEIGVVGILLLAVSVICYLFYKKRKLQRILLEEKIGQILNEYEQKSQRTKLENDQKILGLEEQLKTLNSKKDDLLKKILNADKEVLAKQNDIIQAKKAKQAALMEQLERTDVYHAFMMKVQAKEKASTKDFVDLGNLIDSLFDNFSIRFRNVCPSINSTDMCMCYLIKIGISPIDIASLQLRSPSAISMARKRLARKILGDSGTIGDLDKFIRSF